MANEVTQMAKPLQQPVADEYSPGLFIILQSAVELALGSPV